MPENNVTHEQLRAGQMALIGRFDEHQRVFHDTTSKLFDKLDKVIDANHDNHVYLTRIDGQVMGMQESRAGHIARLEDAEADIAKLMAINNRHEGERGVWAAIMRSPLFAWLAAAGAVLWAGITKLGAHTP